MSGQLLAFIGMCVLITLVPGLDTVLVTRNVVSRGRRAGIMTAAGTSSGLFIHAVAVSRARPRSRGHGSGAGRDPRGLEPRLALPLRAARRAHCHVLAPPGRAM